MNTPNPPISSAEEFQEFYCSAEKHLATLSKASAIVYPWALRISRQSRNFRVSPRQAAEYFEIGYRSVQLAYQELREFGLFELVESGKSAGETSVYKPLTHCEWADKHPGQCAKRVEFPWTAENDALGQKLHNITSGRIKLKTFQIVGFRKRGLNDETLVQLFHVWYPKHREECEPKSDGNAWRKWVGKSFGDYLNYLENSLKDHPSERDNILENAMAGRVFMAHQLGRAKPAA